MSSVLRTLPKSSIFANAVIVRNILTVFVNTEAIDAPCQNGDVNENGFICVDFIFTKVATVNYDSGRIFFSFFLFSEISNRRYYLVGSTDHCRWQRDRCQYHSGHWRVTI